MKWIASVPFLLVAALCVFGLLTNFEPTQNGTVFRIWYAFGIILSLTCINYMLTDQNEP